jgi:thiamine transport system substrate-binding protein
MVQVSRRSRWVVMLAAAVAVGACGSSSTPKTERLRGETVTLLAHDSFAASKGVLAAFTAQTGIKVKVLQHGDAGSMLNQAILTEAHPLADAMYGVDNTFLSRAIERGVYQTRNYAGLAALDPAIAGPFAADSKYAVPVDYGDVCVNFDISWFTAHQVAPPGSIDDLTAARYRSLAVVENPATSSTGLAFLLATIAKYGEGGWQQYWSSLRANGVKIDEGWDQAYNGDFTAGSGKGTRPIVISYASSPPADVVYSDPPRGTPIVASLTRDCFRQVEFAGVLAHAAHPRGAQLLVEFLLSNRFQADMPLQMYVFPARLGTKLPDVFRKFANVATDPLTLPAAVISRERDHWIDQWTQTALR